MEPVQFLNPNTPEFREAMRSIGAEIYLAGVEAGMKMRKDDWVCKAEAKRLIGGTCDGNGSCSDSVLYRLITEKEIFFSQRNEEGTMMFEVKSINAYHERHRKTHLKKRQKKKKGSYQVLYIADRPTGTK